MASLSKCLKTLGRCSLPSSADVKASTELLNVQAQVDSNVSDIGAKQIQQMGDKLKEVDFLETAGVTLVAHSPLLRARQTSLGMLGSMAPDTMAGKVQRVIEVDLLSEKTPQEWTPMYFQQFLDRIYNFEQWLGEQPEDKVAIVGHSQYFKKMLNMDFKFGNCDVWKVDFDAKKGRRPSHQAEAATETAAADEVGEEKKESDSDNAADQTGQHRYEYEGRLPPQWTNLLQLHACEVAGSKRE